MGPLPVAAQPAEPAVQLLAQPEGVIPIELEDRELFQPAVLQTVQCAAGGMSSWTMCCPWCEAGAAFKLADAHLLMHIQQYSSSCVSQWCCCRTAAAGAHGTAAAAAPRLLLRLPPPLCWGAHPPTNFLSPLPPSVCLVTGAGPAVPQPADAHAAGRADRPGQLGLPLLSGRAIRRMHGPEGA